MAKTLCMWAREGREPKIVSQDRDLPGGKKYLVEATTRREGTALLNKALRWFSMTADEQEALFDEQPKLYAELRWAAKKVTAL